MKRSKMKTNFYAIGAILLCCLIFTVVFRALAQDEGFSAKATIEPVEVSGFYRIQLTPDIIPHIKRDFSDLRILDEKGEEVPYVLSNESASSVITVFRTYPILENKQLKNRTRIIVDNQQKDTVSQLQLRMKNADVQKQVKLTGSDDLENWFVIKDQFLFQGLYNDKTTTVTKSVNFPPSDYKYLRFDIRDSLSAPLSILDAGYYDYAVEKGSYQSLPVEKVIQTDSSNGKSYLRILLNGRQLIDLIQFEFKGAEFYYRQSGIYKQELRKVKKREPEVYYTSIKKDIISSDRSNTWRLESLPLDTFYMIIENKDDIPLKIESVKCYQLLHFINVKLENDKSYELIFGNPTANRPNYDLVNFVNKIPKDSPILKAHNVNVTEKTTKKSTLFRLESVWIWIVLGAVFVVMFYMSRKMLGEMGNKS